MRRERQYYKFICPVHTDRYVKVSENFADTVRAKCIECKRSMINIGEIIVPAELDYAKIIKQRSENLSEREWANL